MSKESLRPLKRIDAKGHATTVVPSRPEFVAPSKNKQALLGLLQVLPASELAFIGHTLQTLRHHHRRSSREQFLTEAQAITQSLLERATTWQLQPELQQMFENYVVTSFTKIEHAQKALQHWEQLGDQNRAFKTERFIPKIKRELGLDESLKIKPDQVEFGQLAVILRLENSQFTQFLQDRAKSTKYLEYRKYFAAHGMMNTSHFLHHPEFGPVGVVLVRYNPYVDMMGDEEHMTKIHEQDHNYVRLFLELEELMDVVFDVETKRTQLIQARISESLTAIETQHLGSNLTPSEVLQQQTRRLRATMRLDSHYALKSFIQEWTAQVVSGEPPDRALYYLQQQFGLGTDKRNFYSQETFPLAQEAVAWLNSLNSSSFSEAELAFVENSLKQEYDRYHRSLTQLVVRLKKLMATATSTDELLGRVNPALFHHTLLGEPAYPNT